MPREKTLRICEKGHRYYKVPTAIPAQNVRRKTNQMMIFFLDFHLLQEVPW